MEIAAENSKHWSFQGQRTKESEMLIKVMELEWVIKGSADFDDRRRSIG
jgi:hypothetical protein